MSLSVAVVLLPQVNRCVVAKSTSGQMPVSCAKTRERALDAARPRGNKSEYKDCTGDLEIAYVNSDSRVAPRNGVVMNRMAVWQVLNV